MATQDQPQPADSLISDRQPKSSEVVLAALTYAERVFSSYESTCNRVDAIYSVQGGLGAVSTALGLVDNEYDIFWASMEILKPAIYAKPPRVVADAEYKDAGPEIKATAELTERALNSEFGRTHINEVMLQVRDDLALLNRGVGWVMYENEDGEQRICVEHVDRRDFLHDPARKWSDVAWVARRAWMTQAEMRKRFHASSGLAYLKADYRSRKQYAVDTGATDESERAGVWEVWSRTDNRVFWVTEGVDVMLDEGEPHHELRDFFPCPKPAFGTLKRGTLIPIPDYMRYAPHLDQINELTSRIYTLLEQVRLKAFFPAGGEIGGAVEVALRSTDDSIIIPVPAAAMMQGGGDLVQFLPLAEVATAIQGLIEARGQMIQDFYQLSGISDIMRGATDAQETLGAQRLKSQYGSVRVRDRVDELCRFAADLARIAGEMMSENFSEERLMEISQMDFPTRSEVDGKVKELRDAAKRELEDLAAQQEPVTDPEQAAQAQQQFVQAQQAIIQKYQPALEQLGSTVVIEDVMQILRDEKLRGIVIDIGTDSTVLTDELAEKEARSEFLSAFGNAVSSVQNLLQAGETGAKLAGGILKFVMQPWRANRELDQLIDEFVQAAPQMAASMAEGGENEALVEAQNKLAEAEMAKAQAQTMKVQADAARNQAELQRKIAEMQQKAQKDQMDAATEAERLRLQVADAQGKLAKTEAEINHLQAQTAQILSKIGLDVRKQELEEYQAASDLTLRVADQAATRDDAERRAGMDERRQNFAERRGGDDE